MRAEYHAQVDRLIAALRRSLTNNTKIKITRVVKAGSFAKFTILRKTSTDPVDVDVVFYIAGRSVDEKTLQSLNDTIHDLLVTIYPTKSVEDFQIQRKAATVSFGQLGTQRRCRTGNRRSRPRWVRVAVRPAGWLAGADLCSLPNSVRP